MKTTEKQHEQGQSLWLDNITRELLTSSFLLCALGVACAFGAASPAHAASGDDVWLPASNLFRPLLVAPKEPRFFIEYQRVRFSSAAVPAQGRGREVNGGFVGLGGDFGLWRRPGPGTNDGVQIGLFGVVLSAFNLDAPSNDLINSDFIGGAAASVRRGSLSARLRIFHQSSHLGDELLLNNPEVNRVNLSYEEIDALGSWDAGNWRLYGGGGYLSGGSEIEDLEPWKVQWGVEFRGRGGTVHGFNLAPVFGADFNAFEAQEWTLNTSLGGGVEWFNPATERRVRLLVTHLRGFSPNGQFFTTEKIRNVGLKMQFEF